MSRAYYKELKAKHLCIDCKQPTNGVFVRCEQCRENHNTRYRERYKRPTINRLLKKCDVMIRQINRLKESLEKFK